MKTNKNILVELKNVSMSYEEDLILDHISLYIRDKEFVTLLGPSGCGKTTTLRVIGGFITPDTGDVILDGKRINDIPPHKRPVNTVFQKYALFPHLNVFENVAFGLRINKVPKDEIKPRVKKMLEIVDLKGFERRKVTKLSGGQQQRVAIARALVNLPKILLLDEPLGALDLKLRKEMQLELKKIQQQMSITFVYVTHDQEEALTMSDTIVVMKDGVIQQIGTPEDIYNEPKNAFVADFIGESNIFDGTMIDDFKVSFCGEEFECSDSGFGKNVPIDVVIRPEDIELVSKEIASDLWGEVTSIVFKGVHYEMNVICNGLNWIVHSTKAKNIGDFVGISLTPEDIHIMKKLFKGNTNIVDAEVTAEDTIKFFDTTFTRENLGLEVGTKLSLNISPKDIEVVSLDRADLKVYLESLIYKGAYNELIVFTNDTSIMLHSQNDEQVATDIGIAFKFDNINITPLATDSDTLEV